LLHLLLSCHSCSAADVARYVCDPVTLLLLLLLLAAGRCC
jgi:hypothetical protein